MYTRRGGSTFIECSGDQANSIIMGTAGGIQALGNITTPPFIGSLSRTSLDVSFACMLNGSAAGSNYFDGDHYIQLQDSGGTWHNACKLYDSYAIIGTSERAWGMFEILGNIDIKNYIKSNTSYNLRIDDKKSLRDFLYIYGLTAKMRIYFR